MIKNKKVGHRATNSVSGKTLAEDIYSVAGNTTLPSYQGEEDEVDSFTSSTYSAAEGNIMDAWRGSEPLVSLDATLPVNIFGFVKRLYIA